MVSTGGAGLWLAATSWLAVRKILPPLFSGNPPVYATVAMGKQQRPRLGIST